MIPLTLTEVAAAAGGRLAGVPDPDRPVTGTVVVDSRLVRLGDLFVALPGERVDGHAFAAAAVRSGAVAVLASRAVGVPAVVVPRTVAGLGRLAHEVLSRRTATGDLTVVGITGSSGKTGTKDLLASLLAPLGDTVVPAGSFNNEIGLPLTVCRITPTSRFLVLEYSARGLGQIAALCRVAPPRVGVELNVGTAHLGEFGSRSAIARAKTELVEALPADGVAVLNADDATTLAMRAATTARVLTFGRSAAADVRATGVRLDAAGRASYTLHTPVGSALVRLAQHGEHLVANSLAAAAVAVELGARPSAVAAGLATARPASRWRMEVRETPDGVTVVNDAYNANPESMAAALRALAAMSAGRRSWAVLGEMAELGPASVEEHEVVGRLVADLGIDRLVVVGPAAGPIDAVAAAAGRRSESVPDVATAVELLRSQLRPGDVVLVKASRAAGLERVAGALVPVGVPG
ncbi:MAG: UDP-N-acetylmuramoyl-tripeptide--D-alanyl-D-alanine ligase [Mycobacteriales bacterium]